MDKQDNSDASSVSQMKNNVEAYKYHLQRLRQQYELRYMLAFGTSSSMLNDYLNGLKKHPPSTQQVDLCTLCASHKCEYIDTGGDWIQCDVCKEWVHQQCDGIYNALLAEKIQYTCPRCRVIFCRPHPGVQFSQLLYDPAAIQANEAIAENRRKLAKDRKAPTGKRAAVRRRTKGEDSESSAENTRIGPQEASRVEEQQLTKKVDSFFFRIPVAEYYPRSHRDKELQGTGRRSKQGKEASMAPQAIDNYVNAAFNSLRINHSAPYTAVQDLYLAAQTADPDLPSLPLSRLKSTLISDIVHPGNFASLFLNCFYEFTQAQVDLGSSRTQDPNSNTKSEAARREELITGLLETLLPANQIFYTSLIPILPMDHDLRINVVTSIFDNMLLSLERQRFRYLRMLIPVALNCLLVFQKVTTPAGDQQPLRQLPTNTDVIIGAVVERLQQYDLENIDLSSASYLTWEELLCEQSEIQIEDSEVPALLTKRQWYDLKMRGVPLFHNVGVIRAALLHAIVNANLGIIVLDKAFGREITDHLIHFGVSSGRKMIINYASNSSFDALLELGCIYETTEDRPSNNVTTIQRALRDDDEIMDWDVLETPTSVVWALSFIGNELKRLQEDAE